MSGRRHTKPRGPRAARSWDDISRELERVRGMRKDRRQCGVHFQMLLGMEWALEWASYRGSSMSYIIRNLTPTDDARILAEAYDDLKECIDALMTTDSAIAEMFGKDGAE